MHWKYRYVLLFWLAGMSVSWGQGDYLAKSYFDRGEFEKALISYQELYDEAPTNGVYFQRLVECNQQLQRYDAARGLLEQRLKRFRQPGLLVELGYNYHLSGDDVMAKQYYTEALQKIDENVSNVYGVADVFAKKVLLDYALEAYEKAIAMDAKSRFNYQTGLLYGQKGQLDMMIERFLEEAYQNPQNQVLIQTQFTRFLNDDRSEHFGDMLRKALLKRVQQDQDPYWNQFLSWFFVQQGDYGKAFVQEKALYKRFPENFSNIINLAELAVEEEQDEIAFNILSFILEETQDLDLQIFAHYFLKQMEIKSATPKAYAKIGESLDWLLKKYGISPFTTSLQVLAANFATFYQENPEKGKDILQRALALPLSRFQEAEIKMELADVFLYEEKYNQALLLYTQIQEDLKNDVLGHEASLKAAQTSYYKADFDWAMVQLKVLKSAASQLIANDALELYLLINDNTIADSTQTALTQFARADYLYYKKQYHQAIKLFENIYEANKTEVIADATLLRLGMIAESMNDPQKAIDYYALIISDFEDSIYRDEALFFSGELYHKKLDQPDKAKALYERVIFEHPDSIHFVEARKKYRQLRGDTSL